MPIFTFFSSTTGRTYVYSTKDIEKGPWKAASFEPSLHDHSLFFDDDGRVYMLYGTNNLRLVELTADASGIKPGGFNEIVIRDASLVAAPEIGLEAEGTHLFKINDKYYVMNITWPPNDMRTQIVHRADRITGPYEGKVILHDRGIAQGGLVDTPSGEWFAMLFKDNRAVGRTPYLVPVEWEEGWPMPGHDGKAPMILDIPTIERVSAISSFPTSSAGIRASRRFHWHGNGITIPTTGTGRFWNGPVVCA